MGYKCYVTKETVHGEREHLVPLFIREVLYHNYKIVARGDKLMRYFNGTTRGKEIVQEVKIRGSELEKFLETHIPDIVEQKEVINNQVDPSISKIRFQTAKKQNNIIEIDNTQIVSEDLENDFEDTSDSD